MAERVELLLFLRPSLRIEPRNERVVDVEVVDVFVVSEGETLHAFELGMVGGCVVLDIQKYERDLSV